MIAQAATPDATAALASAVASLLGPAGVAGAMLLWLTYVLMPRQEAAAERREHACEQERGRLVAAFRDELAAGRAEATEDRRLDRQARHVIADRTAVALAEHQDKVAADLRAHEAEVIRALRAKGEQA